MASVGTSKYVLTSSGAGALPTFAYPQLGLTNTSPFRLTLTSNTPVTTADVTAATTLYCTPYTGNTITVYDGSAWGPVAAGEMSIAIPSTTVTMYDVFIYNNAGTGTLELTAWTNDTTRATALTTQDGIYVKTGATTRRFLGCIRTTGVSGQCEDSIAKRYVWNMYNRVPRYMKVMEATANWVYSTNTIRQARATATNQLDFIRGLNEDNLIVLVQSTVNAASALATVGVGIDSTTALSADCSYGFTGTVFAPAVSHYVGLPGVGRRIAVWLESGSGAGTATWYGTNGAGSLSQSGISGSMLG